MTIINPSILNNNAISLLAEVEVDMNLAVPTTTNLYEIPQGRAFIWTHTLFVPAAAGFTTCLACIDIDLGKVGALTDWADAATLATLINGNLCIILKSPETWEVASPYYDAGEILALTVTTGAAAGSLVDVLVLGMLRTP